MQPIVVQQPTARGPWTHASWRPPPLAGLVPRLWYFEGPTSDPLKRILPTGTLEILLNLQDEPYRIVDGARLRHAWVGGLATRATVVAQPPRQAVLGVRLHPVAAYALLRHPVREYAGRSVDLSDVIGRDAGDLVDRCRAARALPERFDLVARWLTARLAAGRGVAEPIAWIARRIAAAPGAASIGALRAQAGISEARLVGAFREQIGVTPKRYARLVRFQHAAKLLQDGSRPLAEVAVAAGFYDQPHMNAEFRALSGLTPGRFVAARHPVGDGITAAER